MALLATYAYKSGADATPGSGLRGEQDFYQSKIAISFQLTAPAVINSAKFYFRRGTNAVGTIYFAIYNVSGPVATATPTGSAVYSTSTYNVSSITTGGMGTTPTPVTLNFANPTLAAGTYAVVVDATAVSGDFLRLMIDSVSGNNPNPNSASQGYSTSGGWITLNNNQTGDVYDGFFDLNGAYFFTGTNAQTGKASISRNLATTQTAKAKLAQNFTKTQGARATISGGRTIIQTAIARLSRNLSKTQASIARIVAQPSKAQTTRARIAKSVTKTQPSTARMVYVLSKTQSATARITPSKTQTAKAFILRNVKNASFNWGFNQASFNGIPYRPLTKVATQLATAAIGQTFAKTQTAKARIALTRTSIQTSKARVSVRLSIIQTAKALIAKRLAAIQTATASVGQTGAKNQLAKAKIATNPTATQTATATLVVTNTVTQSATARIGVLYASPDTGGGDNKYDIGDLPIGDYGVSAVDESNIYGVE